LEPFRDFWNGVGFLEEGGFSDLRGVSAHVERGRESDFCLGKSFQEFVAERESVDGFHDDIEDGSVEGSEGFGKGNG
jgi:hypothetical protein